MVRRDARIAIVENVGGHELQRPETSRTFVGAGNALDVLQSCPEGIEHGLIGHDKVNRVRPTGRFQPHRLHFCKQRGLVRGVRRVGACASKRYVTRGLVLPERIGRRINATNRASTGVSNQ